MLCDLHRLPTNNTCMVWPERILARAYSPQVFSTPVYLGLRPRLLWRGPSARKRVSALPPTQTFALGDSECGWVRIRVWLA